jgi:hypothetical protein
MRPMETTKLPNKLNSIFWLLILILLISACNTGEVNITPSPVVHFVPPTLNPAVDVPLPQPTILPTRQANCQNMLGFEDDLSIPDGTEVSPGQKITKRWLISNQGSCNWNQAYSLQLISGLALGAETNQQLYPARQNTNAVLEIIFSAPDNPGRYNSWWQAYDPDGNRFGDPVYMEIAVKDQD